MSFLRLFPQISVSPIEPRGLDESFLAEQFVDRFKARLAKMQRDLAEHDNWTCLRFSLSVKLFLWKSWAMPIRHSLQLAAWSRGAGGLYVLAHQYRPWSR